MAKLDKRRQIEHFMIRTINEILADFADSKGYNYVSAVAPDALLDGTTKYPAMLWVLPDAESVDNVRWQFRSPMFIVRQREQGESVADNIATLHDVANDMREWLIEETRANMRGAFIDFDYKAMTAQPRYCFDNSGADALEVSLRFVASKCE